jgi:hypothetical protein
MIGWLLVSVYLSFLKNSKFLEVLLQLNSRPQFHLSATGIFRVVADVRAPGGESGNV